MLLLGDSSIICENTMTFPAFTSIYFPSTFQNCLTGQGQKSTKHRLFPCPLNKRRYTALQSNQSHSLSTIINKGQPYYSTTLLILSPNLLRILDNPILSIDFHSSNFSTSRILPIAFFSKQPNVSQISALQDLRSRLLSLGSDLLVFIGNLETHLLTIANTIRPTSIVLPHCIASSSLLKTIHCVGIRNNIIIPQHTYVNSLLPPLTVFPPPPPTTSFILSSTPISPKIGGGETAAHNLLYRLISFQLPFRAIQALLTREVRAGYITSRRIATEVARKYHHLHIPSTQFQHNYTSNNLNFNPNATNIMLSAAAGATICTIPVYDVNGGDRRGVEWDSTQNKFVLQEWEHAETERRMTPGERVQEFVRRRRLFFMRSFFPDDVTPDYYSFTAWRFAQRCVSATIGVFGTSSLLRALGIRSGRIGQAAIVSWVLKDGLGRVGKMIWAGSMGKDFDVDPKRWRFRSALLYAGGNGLEIITQIFPASFLLFATVANSMKQVSMLTSSATRNAMYRSFGERSQNIANITAKGEAQIVVADLIGMAFGIRLSKAVGSSRTNILGSYSILTVLDIIGIYMELRQVVFRTLNAERSDILINQYLTNGHILTPAEVSAKESIFLKAHYKSKVRLTSIAKAARNPQEMDLLLKVFKRERFIVSTPRLSSKEQSRLVLRNDASNEDVLRALLMIGYVRRHVEERNDKKEFSIEEQESILRSARKASIRTLPKFLAGTEQVGWNTDNLLFNTMKRRGYWKS